MPLELACPPLGAFRFFDTGGGGAPASGVIEKLDMPGMFSFGVVGATALPTPVPDAVVEDRRVLTPDDLSLSPNCGCADAAEPSEF